MDGRFRIRCLLTGRTLVQSDRGRDLVAYWQENYRPGHDDWWWQFHSRQGWQSIPTRVLKVWMRRSAATPAE